MQSKPYNKRRLFKFKNWSYLLDDNDKTAWIAKGHIGRCKRYKIPNSVDIDGKRYTITSIEMGAFKLSVFPNIGIFIFSSAIS